MRLREGAGCLVVAAVVLVGTVLNVQYIVADNHYLKGRAIYSGAQSVAEIERAIELNPYNDMYRLELGATWQRIFRANAESLRQKLLAGEQDQALAQETMDALTNAETAYRDTIEYVPNEYDTYVFTANLYNEASLLFDRSYSEKAISVGELGVMVEPYGPAIRVQLGLAYMTTGNIDKAIEHLEVATSLDSDYMAAFTLLAQAYQAAGRVEEARAAAQHILDRDPTNSDALGVMQSLDASATTTTP